MKPSGIELISEQRANLKLDKQQRIVEIDNQFIGLLGKDKSKLIDININNIDFLNFSILEELLGKVDKDQSATCFGKVITNQDIFYKITVKQSQDGYDIYLQQELTTQVIQRELPLNLVFDEEFQVIQASHPFRTGQSVLDFILIQEHRQAIQKWLKQQMQSEAVNEHYEYGDYIFNLSSFYQGSATCAWHLNIATNGATGTKESLDEIITRLSVNLLEADHEDYDQVISESIAAMGKFSRVDRVYIFSIDNQAKTATNTFEWCQHDIEPQIKVLQKIPFSDYQWIFATLYQDSYVYIEDVDALPTERSFEKINLQQQQIKSLLIVPILSGKEISGFLGFDSVKSTRQWTTSEIKLLQIAGKLIVNNQTHRQNNLKIQETEKSYQKLFHNAYDAMLLIDRDNQQIVDANLSACKLYQFDWEQIGKLKTNELFSVDNPYDQNLSSRFRTTHHSLNGNSFRVEVHNSVVNMDNKDYSLYIVRDISEHEKFTRALNESRKRFEMISEATSDFSFSIRRDSKGAALEWCSESLLKKFGNKNLETLKSMVHQEDISRFIKFITQLESSLAAETELRLVLPDKPAFWIHLSAKLEKEESFERIIGAARDINEQKKAELGLLESEQRFHFLFEHMPSGLITLRIENEEIVVQNINQYAEKILDIKKESCLQKNFSNLASLQDQQIISQVKMAKSTGKIQRISQFLHKTDPEIILEMYFYQLPSAEVVILFNDISNRINTEKALRESQKGYKILFNNASDSIFIHDLEGNFINVNHIACKKLGYSKEELLHKNSAEIDTPKYRRLVSKRLADLMENGKISFETEHIRKDGKHVPVDMVSRLIKYKDKIAVLSTARDITERKIVEEKLNYELRLNKAISRLAEELLGNKSTVSDLAHHILNYALEITNSKHGFVTEIDEDNPSIHGKVTAMAAPDCQIEPDNSQEVNPKEHSSLNDLVIKTRKSFFSNDPMNHPSYSGGLPRGHFKVNSFLSVPAIIDDQIIGQIALANTTDKYSETDTVAIERIANLYALTIQMERSRRELETRNSELNNFVYKVSHDLRAPLASIAGLVNVIKLLAMDEQAKSYIDLIDNRIQKLDRFIHDILSHSRNLNTTLNYETIDLKKIVAGAISELNYMPEARNVKIVLDVDGREFFSDKLRINEILRNLISNGFKYHNPYAKNQIISISTRVDPESVTIKYEDNGTGIESSILPKIFDMFYKGSDKSNSSGLGLYIVKQAVDKLKGNIFVESEVGKGTSFTVEIPNQKI